MYAQDLHEYNLLIYKLKGVIPDSFSELARYYVPFIKSNVILLQILIKLVYMY
jgi:hypothetical protein